VWWAYRAANSSEWDENNAERQNAQYPKAVSQQASNKPGGSAARLDNNGFHKLLPLI
jgi:hypothetical protein